MKNVTIRKFLGFMLVMALLIGMIPSVAAPSYAAEGEGIDVTITVKKTLEGREVKEGEFEFELWNWDDSAKIEDATGKSSVKNDANGEATFTIHFDGPTGDGGAGYYVREVKGDDPDIEYDESHKQVIINVKANKKAKPNEMICVKKKPST